MNLDEFLVKFQFNYSKQHTYQYTERTTSV